MLVAIKVSKNPTRIENIRVGFFDQIIKFPHIDLCALRAFLSPLRHMEQILLVTSCDLSAGIGASLQTDNTQQTDTGWTDVTLEIVF